MNMETIFEAIKFLNVPDGEATIYEFENIEDPNSKIVGEKTIKRTRRAQSISDFQFIWEREILRASGIEKQLTSMEKESLRMQLLEWLNEWIFDLKSLSKQRQNEYLSIKILFDNFSSWLKSIDLSGLQNNFNHLPIKNVAEYFNKGLVITGFITEDALSSYIKQAFDLKAPPSKRLQIANTKSKKEFIGIFYAFYNDISMKPHGKKSQYVKLLTDYFEGFEFENINTNFAKSNY